MTEEWILFREFKKSNRYYKKGDILTVSNYGNVLLNGQPHECSICRGYYYLCYSPLHRIIAEKFLLDWDPNKEVDHKDRNRLNNMVTNLLLCDHKQNMNNPLSIQHMRECQRETQNNPLTIQNHIEGSRKKSVLQYTLDNKFVAEFISVQEAARKTKICRNSIKECCKHRYKSAGGYIWKYKEE